MTEHAASDNAENQQAWAQLQKGRAELAADAEQRGDVVVALGEGPRDDAAGAPAQLATIPKAAQQYFEGFQVVAARIGDDLDDFDALEEALDALDHDRPVSTGTGSRNTNTRHSSICLSLWTWATEQAQAALGSRDWPDAYKRLAALQRALTANDFWLRDTDDPEGNQEFFKTLASAWEKLFALDTKKWTSRAKNADALKAAIRSYATGLARYDVEYDEEGAGYTFSVAGVTS